MKLKPGVRLKDLQPQMLVALLVADEVHPTECIITSANDSKHGLNSRHYKGCALDFRTKNIPTTEAKLAFCAAMKTALGPDFDIVLEDLGKDNEHLHVEWDPK